MPEEVRVRTKVIRSIQINVEEIFNSIISLKLSLLGKISKVLNLILFVIILCVVKAAVVFLRGRLCARFEWVRFRASFLAPLLGSPAPTSNMLANEFRFTVRFPHSLTRATELFEGLQDKFLADMGQIGCINQADDSKNYEMAADNRGSTYAEIENEPFKTFCSTGQRIRKTNLQVFNRLKRFRHVCSHRSRLDFEFYQQDMYRFPLLLAGIRMSHEQQSHLTAQSGVQTKSTSFLRRLATPCGKVVTIRLFFPIEYEY
uniref:Uncharacterized protein n=1 Tax=Glossina brevipalpis TaxID=37001 RepID=A0A1A9WBL7_9MUSC